MSFGIMQESNGSDDDSDDSESEYTIGVPTPAPRHLLAHQCCTGVNDRLLTIALLQSPPTSGPPSQIGSPRT